jgi:hypothetical protein
MSKATLEAIAKREAARGDVRNRPTRSRTASGARRPAKKTEAKAKPAETETKTETES